MGVVLQEGPSSARLLSRPARRSGASSKNVRTSDADCIEIGLINNMPDAALEKTERQFVGLLGAAATPRPIRLRLFSLPELDRNDAARAYLRGRYSSIDELWDSKLDGLIITGTEPRTSNLADEPYWRTLTRVIDWAETNTRSTIFSCLAAHAAVLHMDNIRRHPLPDKCFGLFDCTKASNHAILKGVPATLSFPHSRWNELREEELVAAGYEMLTRSRAAGVDCFARHGNSLFVFFHGHPEYEARTLLGEYRRDVGRFLRGERPTYPSLPHGYFSVATAQRLTEFRRHALADRREALLEEFPVIPEDELTAPWRPASEQLIANWLALVVKRLSARGARRATTQSNKPLTLTLPRLRGREGRGRTASLRSQ